MPVWEPPPVFDEYRLIRPLRRGGMGQVYLGHDLLLDRPVAVKFIAADEPDERAKQRFLTEGRAIARLQHANVVAIHRVGEVDGRPYLVAEFVRGKSLDLVQKPMLAERVIRIGIGLARGLAAAHRRGVLHRDIKPANAMLDDDGEVKLVDFGLAKFLASVPTHGAAFSTLTMHERVQAPAGAVALTRSGGLLGTPAYMAPELFRGEDATRRSDLYSLGALLFELLTGKAPSGEGAAMPAAEEFPSPGIERDTAAILERCLQRDPQARFASADELADALERLVAGRDARRAPEGNPYRGLRPFEAEHRSEFFGRDADTRLALQRLRDETLLIVAGDSGVGKSSLCRAGVLPLVLDGELKDGRTYAVARVVPGKRPVSAIVAALAAILEADEESLDALLRRDSTALLRKLRARHAGGRLGTVVFVDQLEELFTQSDPGEASLFAEAVGNLVAPSAGVRVLATIRGDFITRLASLRPLGDDIPRALLVLRPLSPEQTRQTIVGPARVVGFAFESDEMVADLVESSSSMAGGLPLLQFALEELWNSLDRERGVIPLSALQRIGGVRGALARHADEVLSRLLPDEKSAARRILLRLVTRKGTGARGTVSDLGAEDPVSRSALDALVAGRLVVVRGSDEGPCYELAHEALIEEWAQMRDWLAADGDRRQIRTRISAATEEWRRLGKRRDALWDRAHLREAARLDRAELDAEQVAFVEASRRSVAWDRRRRMLLLAAGPILAIAIIGAARLRLERELDAQAASRYANGVRAFQEATRFDGEAAEARAQALRAFAASTGADQWHRAESLWAEVLDRRASAESAYDRSEAAFESALAIRPGYTKARSAKADALSGKAGLSLRFGDFHQFSKLAERVAALQGGATGMLGASTLEIDVLPHGTAADIARIEAAGGRSLLRDRRPLGTTPLVAAEVSPGSYLLVFRGAGAREFRLPVRVAAGDRIRIHFQLPGEVPEGWVFVPPGRFLAGFAGDEGVRHALGAPPLHEVVTGAYLIARQEVTFAEYVEFLEASSDREREARTPSHRSHNGSLELKRTKAGWELVMQPASQTFRVRWGEPIRYPGRQRHAVQDFRKFPVEAISFGDARAYAGWYSEHRLKGAHVCDDHEWERAARGADGREFTTGDRLDPGEVNIDETYGREPLSFGPDEVGTHPESDSILGVQDMVGNAMEMVVSKGGFGAVSVRGGSWYYDEWTARLPARFVFDETTRSATVGFRLCADVVDASEGGGIK